MTDITTKNKKYDAPIQIDYWPCAPIIVNGIDAYNFFYANLASTRQH